MVNKRFIKSNPSDRLSAAKISEPYEHYYFKRKYRETQNTFVRGV